MKKHFLFLSLLACVFCASSVVLSSCGDDDDNDPIEKPGNETAKSIVGAWSGIMEGDEVSNRMVRVHFNFKANGTFEQIMPAWEEIDYGKYTVSGNVVTFELTSLEWLWPRENEATGGYDNVYDQYGCYWYPDKYAENRIPYEDPFAQYALNWPGRVNFSAKYSFDKAGRLHFETLSGEGPGFGLQLVYYNNPNFEPVHFGQ